MKLNKQGKDELRAKVSEKLKNVPSGQRIHLEKELLEELLFDNCVLNKEKNIVVKVPIWSGNFLSKLDLSEVSFENVAWSLITYKEVEGSHFCEKADAEMWEKISNGIYQLLDEDKQEQINYSNTNAHIDFKQSIEYKLWKVILINCVDFSGTDLSQFNVDVASHIDGTNLSNTNFPISTIIKDPNKHYFHHDDLTGLDLSMININLYELINDDLDINDECIFTNTGLNITYNAEQFNTLKPDRKEIYLDIIRKLISSGKIDGCFLNGKLLKSKEEREKISKQQQSNYEKYKQDIFSNILGTIDEQIGHPKK